MIGAGRNPSSQSPTTPSKPQLPWLSGRLTDDKRAAIYDIFSSRSSCRRGYHHSSSFGRISTRMRLYRFRGAERRRRQARIDDTKLTNRGGAGGHDDRRERL